MLFGVLVLLTLILFHCDFFFVKIVFDMCHVFFCLSSKLINFVRIVNQTVKAKHAKMAYG